MAVTGFKAAMMGRRPTSLHIDLKDVVTGKSFPQRFSPSDRVERIELENNDYQYLYTEGDISYAMHPVSFEQIEFDSKYVSLQLELPSNKSIKSASEMFLVDI